MVELLDALEERRVTAVQRAVCGRLIEQRDFKQAFPLLARMLPDNPADAELLGWQAEVTCSLHGWPSVRKFARQFDWEPLSES